MPGGIAGIALRSDISTTAAVQASSCTRWTEVPLPSAFANDGRVRPCAKERNCSMSKQEILGMIRIFASCLKIHQP